MLTSVGTWFEHNQKTDELTSGAAPADSADLRSLFQIYDQNNELK